MKKLMLACAFAMLATLANADDYCANRPALTDCKQMDSEQTRIDYCGSIQYTDKVNCYYYPERPTPGESSEYCKEIYWEDWPNCDEYREYCESINFDNDDEICGGD